MYHRRNRPDLLGPEQAAEKYRRRHRPHWSRSYWKQVALFASGMELPTVHKFPRYAACLQLPSTPSRDEVWYRSRPKIEEPEAKSLW